MQVIFQYKKILESKNYLKSPKLQFSNFKIV